MKVRKPCRAILAGVALVVLGATTLTAQHAGFRIGIAPTVGPPAVVSGFAQPAVGPFGMGPPVAGWSGVGFFPFGFAPTPAPVFVNGVGFVSQSLVTQPFGGFIVQTPQIFVQGTTFVPSPFVVPGQVVVPGQIVWPRSTFIENPRSQVRPGHSIPFPGVGTPRAQVLTQLGHPTGSIVTRNGETLYFNGGISVFIQNGQVAVPR